MAKDSFVKHLRILLHTDDENLRKIKARLDTIGDDVATKMADGFTKMVDKAGQFFEQTIKNAIKELDNMLNYSQLSSSKTRDLAFGYGFSASQAYGWTNALKAVGLESEEDLFYANEQEMAQFREAFEKYSNYYTELYDSGFFEQLQEYQFEMYQFKKDMEMEVIRFFMNNKDTIKSGMKAIVTIASMLAQAFGWLVNLFDRAVNPTTASTADVVSQYNQTTNSSVVNANVNNTFNGVSATDAAWLSNAGEMAYEQTIKALGGDV